MLGSAGGHREEWADPEPPADDDGPDPRLAADVDNTGDPDGPAPDPGSDERMQRLQHDLDVANNDRYSERQLPDPPECSGGHVG